MSLSGSQKELSDKRKNHFRILISENTTYPLATITYHGPSPEQPQKLWLGY